jgi:hypothetical protein
VSGIVKKSFDTPDEVRAPDKANVNVCDLGGVAAAKMVLQPGWSWSTCIKPVVGGESCQARHVGTVLSGSMSAKHEDGTTETFVAGDVYVIEPGHDGWVEGNEECVALEFNATAAKTYATAK